MKRKILVHIVSVINIFVAISSVKQLPAFPTNITLSSEGIFHGRTLKGNAKILTFIYFSQEVRGPEKKRAQVQDARERERVLASCLTVS